MDNPCQKTCPFCGTTPSEVNKPDADFTPNSDMAFCELCLSILHFPINMFRHFCNVGARIKANVKVYPAYGERKQAKIQKALDEIYDKFKELGLQLQKKRMADGNSARTAFNNLEFFSETTGISVELLSMFNIVRICLASTLKKGCLYNLILWFTVFEKYPKYLIYLEQKSYSV